MRKIGNKKQKMNNKMSDLNLTTLNADVLNTLIERKMLAVYVENTIQCCL